MELEKLVEAFEEKFLEIRKEVNEVKENIAVLEKKGSTPPAVKEENIERKSAFFNYLRGKGIETKAIVEDSTGEILVPEDLYAEIIRTLPKLNPIRRYATAVTVRGNRLRYRGLTEVSVAWTKLETSGTTLNETANPTVSEGTIYVRDLYGLIKIGEDLLQDSDIALERIIIDSFARAIAEAEDSAFLSGNPANGEPEGVLTNTNIATVTVDTSKESFDFDDILELYYSVPAQYRANAIWVMNSATEQVIRSLKDTQGRYILQPSVSEPLVTTILGRPVVVDEAMPDNTILFGDFKSGYLILDKTNGLTTKRLEELFALSGMVGLMVHYRVGGGVIRPEAFAKLVIS